MTEEELKDIICGDNEPFPPADFNTDTKSGSGKCF